MKKIKIISMILILCMLCSACGWTSEEVAPIHTENTEINKLSPYLSITRSFYSEESESGMGSRCFFYDIKEKKLEQKGTVSYTSSHPLLCIQPEMIRYTIRPLAEKEKETRFI